MSYGEVSDSGPFVLPRAPACEARNDADTKGGRRRTYSAQEWERQKTNIRLLYITQKLDLRRVTARMSAEHNFCATVRMYKTRLEAWGFLKNIKDADWQVAAVLWDDREKEGRATSHLPVTYKHVCAQQNEASPVQIGANSQFELRQDHRSSAVNALKYTIHGRRKTVRELQRHIKTRRISEKEYIANARASGSRSSDSIRCISPVPGQLEISSSDSTELPSVSSGYSFVGQIPPESQEMSASKSSGTSRPPHVQDSRSNPQPADTTPSWAVGMPDLTPDTDGSGNTDLLPTSASSPQHGINCDQVQQDLGFMLIQTISPHALTAFPNVRDVESWQLVSPPDEAAQEQKCPKCDTPSRSHSPFPPDWLWDSTSELPQKLSYQTLDPSVHFHTGSDEASIFQASCYAACMYGGQGRYDLLAKSLQRADQIFEKMIMYNNSMTLLSILLTLNILHAHDQGSMAASIIRSAHQVACNMLGEGNSVTLTIGWATAAAGSKLSQSIIKAGTLRAILADLQSRFGEKHHHSVTALYCLAFHLAYDKEYAEAETLFGRAFEICNETLGPKHLQTVSCLNGLSRAQARQNKYDQAIATLQASIASHPLGPNHPYRLESMRRLALIYKKINRNDLVEPIYWAVLRGRIKTLGKSHSKTETARSHLERLLKTMGKWDEQGRKAEEVQALFEDGSAALTSDIEAF